MTITLNNISSLDDMSLICLTDIPNILKVQDETGGTKAHMSFTFSNDLASVTTDNNQWHITFLDETIINTVTPKDAINKNFYISNSSISTAASVAKALRNCSTIAAAFDVIFDGNSTVTLQARAVGQIWTGVQNFLSTNIPSMYLQTTYADGSANSSLYGAMVNVDVYSNGNYITTLEKNYYNGEAAFNISPVITTFAEYGVAQPFNLKLSAFKNGEYTYLGEMNNNAVSIGYLCNQGEKYLNADHTTIAMNYKRGTYRPIVANNTILYVYKPEIPISFYKPSNTTRISTNIKYLDSAYNTLFESSGYLNAFKTLQENVFPLGNEYWNETFYVDLTIGTETIRYNVIKPLKATEECQRILWRNSYGGVSFTDWTGEKTIQNNISTQTYEKNIFDFYTSDKNELEKIYDVELKTTYTLKSHLLEADGRWIYYDLMLSNDIWTTINGEKYGIIIESLSVDETDNNNVFQATIKFRFSQPLNLL